MSEILAPCGAMESLTAAVNAGADAVYLGEEYFSARKNADNFTAEQLCDAVRFCHYSGVKVYVTLNTLVFDREIPLLAKAIENCAKADVDAFIVQDMGVARLANCAGASLTRFDADDGQFARGRYYGEKARIYPCCSGQGIIACTDKGNNGKL